MTEREALVLTAKLVSCTTGWNDQAAELLTRTIQGWSNAQVAAAVIDQFCSTWTQPQRPTLGLLVQAYRAAAARLEGPRAEIDERIPTFTEGVQIARDNYAAECRRHGREPNWAFFDSMFDRALHSALRRAGEG